MTLKDMRRGREGGIAAEEEEPDVLGDRTFQWDSGDPDDALEPLGMPRLTRWGGDTDEELRDLEHRYWQALKDRDVEAMKLLTDEPCFLAGPEGVRRIEADDLEHGLSAPRTHLEAFEIRGLQIRRIGEDVAILAYEVHEELTVEGERVSIDAADASTWIRRDGRWVCALRAEAPTGDRYGRDRIPRPRKAA